MPEPHRATKVDPSSALLAAPGHTAMWQRWRHLGFLHWAVEPQRLRPLVPEELEIDTYDGRAFVGLVPFTMHGVRLALCPPVPGFSRFHEINVRTYVRHRGADPGIFFFSLDAANRTAVLTARALWRLPYHFAAMDLAWADGTVRYRSTRRWPGPLPGQCRLSYGPHGPAAPASPETLEHFLVERYALYTTARGKLLRGRVQHAPYPLQPGHCAELEESLLAAAGIARPAGAPLVHYAAGVDVRVLALERVAGTSPDGSSEKP